ncbi:hypothetical protein [Agarilytica rhodophyticola]|uniref:hypothetical protein n=1 Tax=Agarilytica rhodophyticola TaxID=1737490 RepID=UPI000B341854|nr:hypothetical protein [Agarilytica rhodophyticola]
MRHRESKTTCTQYTYCQVSINKPTTEKSYHGISINMVNFKGDVDTGEKQAQNNKEDIEED